MTREELISKVSKNIFINVIGADASMLQYHFGKDVFDRAATSALNDIFDALKEPTRDMQQVVSANWGRRTWSEYQDVINASPLAPEE